MRKEFNQKNSEITVKLDNELNRLLTQYMKDNAIASRETAVIQALRERFVRYDKIVSRSFATYQGDYVALDSADGKPNYYVAIDAFDRVQSYDYRDYKNEELITD